MCENSENLIELVQEKFNLGNELLKKIENLNQINGMAKIRRKICSEITFLEKMIASDQLKINHILCSNLMHFAYLVNILSKANGVQGVDVPIKFSGCNKSTARVDIVADDGRRWIKVIARNPKALTDIALGRSNFGTKSILDHATHYKAMATDNQHYFEDPKIIFDFANDIDDELRTSLNESGIVVRINGLEENSKMTEIEASESDERKIFNLDVTTIMAYVSALTNGSYHWIFTQPILTEQAIRENECHVKEFLEEIFKNNELIACETAIESFQTILKTVGGDNEKKRSELFLNRINVLPDLMPNEENETLQKYKLQLSGKIRDRTYKIITFGLHHKAVTITANKGAIEAAKMQGVFIPSIVHEARALTEQKECSAKALSVTD